MIRLVIRFAGCFPRFVHQFIETICISTRLASAFGVTWRVDASGLIILIHRKGGGLRKGRGHGQLKLAFHRQIDV